MIRHQLPLKPLFPAGRTALGIMSCNFTTAITATTKGRINEDHNNVTEKKDIKVTKDPIGDSSSVDYKIYTKPTFSHPPFTKQQMEAIKFEHRPQVTFRDWYANWLVQILRFGFDVFTGYRHIPIEEALADPKAYPMTTRKWMTRFIFLESIAGVPGAVGGFLRHLHSLRLLKRDKAWIETLIEESYNERMHLLTFVAIWKPNWLTRSFIKIAQGVFCNLFFLSYLTTPTTCHRFVGYLEEEAIKTYSRCLEDIDHGLVPELSNLTVPPIAKAYWDMPDSSTMRDLILYIRADEAKHREVNHTLANLKQNGEDRNPFAHTIVDETHKEQPVTDLSAYRGQGWERDEINYVDERKYNK